MSIFFTADTHFGHGAVLRYCSRPCASASEMDEALFANWSACVGPKDTVYHLGDVLFGNREQAALLATIAATRAGVSSASGTSFSASGSGTIQISRMPATSSN